MDDCENNNFPKKIIWNHIGYLLFARSDYTFFLMELDLQHDYGVCFACNKPRGSYLLTVKLYNSPYPNGKWHDKISDAC